MAVTFGDDYGDESYDETGAHPQTWRALAHSINEDPPRYLRRRHAARDARYLDNLFPGLLFYVVRASHGAAQASAQPPAVG